MCFTKVWDFPYEDKNELTWKDSDLELLSTWKKWSSIPNVFRKLTEVKKNNVHQILLPEEYILMRNWWIQDDQILDFVKERAVENWVEDDYNFIINRWWNNNSKPKRYEDSL